MKHAAPLSAPVLALVYAAVTGLAACTPVQSPILRAASLAHPHAADLWADKCGACHVPVEPGTRSRAVIGSAMERHHARVQINADEWREMIAFLAFDPAKDTGPAATMPAPAAVAVPLR